MLIGQIMGPLGQDTAPANPAAPVLPPGVATELQRLIQNTTGGGPSSGRAAFGPGPTAEPPPGIPDTMTAGQRFWAEHKDKLLIGGAVVGGLLVVYLVAK